MADKKLWVYEALFMPGDAWYFVPLLNTDFDNFSVLATKLELASVVIATKPYQEMIDHETDLLIESYLLTHLEGKWQLGTMGLVEATDAEYKRLLESMILKEKRELRSG